MGDHDCRGGFIAQKFYLDFVLASREFGLEQFLLKEDKKQEAIQAVTELGSVLLKRPQNSLFWNDCVDEEGPQSAVASELFQVVISMLQHDKGIREDQDRLRVTHQQHVVARSLESEFELIRMPPKKDDKGMAKEGSREKTNKTDDRIDVCVWFVHEDETLGACVLAACEYKPDHRDAEARIAQADMYGSNIFLLHKKPCIIIDIAGGNDLSNWKISANGLVEAEFSTEEFSFEKTHLYTGHGAEAIVMVAWGLIMARPSFPLQLSDFGERLGPNVGEIDGCIYKVYDRAVVRKPNLEVIKEITGDMQATLLSSKDESLHIMKMTSFPNDWKKEIFANIFPTIICKLKCLHETFGPHGDIRLANLLSSGHIIDFDFVGMTQYPDSLNLSSQDRRRHPDVEGMIKAIKTKNARTTINIDKSHDWFSLGTVMKLFEPLNSDHNEVWTKICKHVTEGKVDLALKCDFNYKIKLKNNNIPLRRTGYTPQKQAKNKAKTKRKGMFTSLGSEHLCKPKIAS